MAGLRRFRPALPGGKNLLAGMQRPPVRLMQRMSPMIRDVSRDPDPLFGSEGCGLATLSGVISDKAGPIIVEWAAAIQHVGPCRAPISEPWISTSQLGFHSYRLTRASFATRVQRTRFQDRWAVFLAR